MSAQSVVLDFVDCSSADANRYAQDLGGALIRLDSSIEIERATQEIVSSLVLLFGTPVVASLAHAIYTFLARNSATKLRINTPDGRMIAESLDSRDAARIAEAFPPGEKVK